ncbi:MAG: ATP-binding protein [Chloroflexota bacterium]
MQMDLHQDPIRQVRAAKRWAFAGIAWAVAVLFPLYYFTLNLSTAEVAFVLLPAAFVGFAAVDLAGRWQARVHRRYAYPHRLGYELAKIHDFEAACNKSSALMGEWLDLDAAVVGWLSEDGDELVPVGSFGLPDGWLSQVPRMSARSFGFPRWQEARQLFALRPSPSDAWFGPFFPKDRVIYAPLLSRESPMGVVGLVAAKGNPSVGDKQLLAALGMVMGLALDNCRLYEGQRAHAEHFQELNRMKSDFLTTVSHELRTPLTSIMMGAEMLLEEEETRDPGSTRGKLVRNIVKGSSRLASLVNDLVAVSREDSMLPRLEMESMPIADSVTNAVSIVQPLLSAKKQTIEIIHEDPNALVRIDRLRFEQVLINLLSNAQRYSPPGGHMLVETSVLPSGETQIAITDSGPGVPKDDAKRIFEPFYRGDRSGLGLGLAIAQSIVELHSGRIWVEPAPSGSRFCVALPAEHAKRTEEPQDTGAMAVKRSTAKSRS